MHAIAAIIESHENVRGFLALGLTWRCKNDVVLVYCDRLIERL